MKKIIITLTTILTLVTYSCVNEEGPEIIQDYSVLFEEYFGDLSQDYVSALVIMGEELNYELDTLKALANELIVCSNQIPCLEATLGEGEIHDFKMSLREVTLPTMKIDIQDQSVWTADYDEGSASVTLTHNTKNVILQIDLDNGLDDGKLIGVSPIINDEAYFADDSMANQHLIRQSTDGGAITRVELTLLGEEVRFNTSGGTYGNLVETDYSKTVFMNASFQIFDGRLHSSLSGLYYILLPVNPTTLIFKTDGEIKEYTVEEGQTFTVYQENISQLKAEGAFSNYIYLDTEVRRLQFQAHGDRNFMELDFDHTYKDRGQESVSSILIIDTEI